MTDKKAAVWYEHLHTEKHTGARRGRLHTPHGTYETPMFMPVGTQGAVKGVNTRTLKEIGSQFILANTYHLWVRPGDELIAQAGGLHKYMGWDQAILTDSGGFQVFSLSDARKLKEEGVTFQNHVNGDKMFLSPEVAMRIQNNLGSDVMMQLDEAIPYFETYDYIKDSMQRSLRWADRAQKYHQKTDTQALFGIVQGAGFRDLRTESATELVKMDLPGYAVGGLSVGESKKEMNRVLDFTVPLLPEDKPRYLMGVAAPDSLIDGVIRGIDMFDCVLPTRIGRKGTLMTSKGRVVIKNSRYKADFSPIDPDLTYYSDNPIRKNQFGNLAQYDLPNYSPYQNLSRSYLHHLFNANERLGAQIASEHNLRYLLHLMEEMRTAIEEDRLLEFRERILEEYGYNKKNARLF
ncbi:tRNA guanosine(34) transglycosylase Tgt [Fructobacillus fructosus]|uniref:Queuine tRNA-ribosyltransferase n=1 Tax=Fructobacillus fructosus TaxID=1631 RepID=A0ABM9MTN2_9LACO|nr:tRNA guanosine(34) transglycosylase Tgt [Fructobacillus fructosus]MBD9365799.1 tRNA guanosine(34) transglycosylase Tgt [Leuconostoc mesenteroides]MBC9118973.1 tRNA guanosine(34) transglycosylase Tgt [Fructobacillus fructosus]MCK8638551.1 tRNA guanosine(34) transglycosylase Tgt [Fructobacillus fructosus]CAK1238015.1 Queuine/archaeosine tRNA-ribosyltransferase (Tgt) [Fructobacillus fructosus]CAK1238315.1 Queuine/archaeosine tRNA-ribosyltransferase (Tgt) [Fructobacillus fructosus]